MWWIGFIIYALTLGSFFPKTKDTFKTPGVNIKWVIDKSSSLSVTGRSNINTFTCEIAGYNGNDTLTIISDGSGGSVKLNGGLQITVSQFNCHNKLITGDLRKTLKSKEHPFLKVRFLSLERAPLFKQSTDVVKGWVEVELAGVKKVMQIPFMFGNNTSAITTMTGEKIFCFTDFQLSPPTKMAGAVKIKDEFTVDFRLKLKLAS